MTCPCVPLCAPVRGDAGRSPWPLVRERGSVTGAQCSHARRSSAQRRSAGGHAAADRGMRGLRKRACRSWGRRQSVCAARVHNPSSEGPAVTAHVSRSARVSKARGAERPRGSAAVDPFPFWTWVFSWKPQDLGVFPGIDKRCHVR